MPKRPTLARPRATRNPAPKSPTRDALLARSERLGKIRELLRPVPDEWLKSPTGRGNGSAAMGDGSELEPLDCLDYTTLVRAWRKALRWTDGLDRALSVMLATALSTKQVGDPLWVKVMSPPSGGKSTLCEALSVSKEYTLAKSTIRGFHSGFKTSWADDDEDNSLTVLVNGKTLITKDGDTLLTAPNLSQILSEARDLYDSTARTHYRNKASKDYSGIRFTWLLCGTSSLRQIDSSELGERFLDCVISEEIDDELEDEVGWRIANRTARNLLVVADGKPETRYDADLANAMQLSAGYLEYLRRNAGDLLSTVRCDDEQLRLCSRLGKFVAFMRARPSKRQRDEEEAERELSYRLVSQHVRLAMCLAVVLNRSTMDEEVMRRVRAVALDTARGQTLKIARCLYHNPAGKESTGIALNTDYTPERTRSVLSFLRKIGVVEQFSVRRRNTTSTRKLYRLSDKVRRLYEQVMEED